MTFPVLLSSFSYLLKIELEIDKNVIHWPWSVRIRKNCALCLEYSPQPAAPGRTQDLGKSFSQYGVPAGE